MTRRGWKRTGYCLLAGVLLLLALGWVWRQALPSYVARRSVTWLREQGLGEAQVQVESLGIRSSELGPSRLAGVWGSIALDHARVRYGLAALQDRRLEEIALDGLRIELDLEQAAGLAPSDTNALAPGDSAFTDWSDRLPVRRFLVSHGALELHRGPVARRLAPLLLSVTNQEGNVDFVIEAINDQTGDRLKLTGRASGDGPAEVSASLTLSNLAAWLPLWLPSASLNGLPFNLGALRGRIDAQVDLAGRLGNLRGSLEPLGLSWPSGELNLRRTEALAGLAAGELGRVEVNTGLELKLQSGIEVVAADLAARLDEARQLKVAAPGLQFRYPGDVSAMGDLRLTVVDPWAGTNASGTLAFDLDRIELPGVRVELLKGELEGNQERLKFQIPALELVAAGRWQFGDLTGELRTPLLASASLTATGSVQGNWTSNLVVADSLPVEIEASREGERIRGTLGMTLTNLVMPAFVDLPMGGVSGRLSLAAESGPDRSAGSLELDLSLPQAVCFGWRLQDVAVDGEARVALGAPKGPLLPGFLLRFLQAAPALSLDRLIECFFDLNATVGRASLANDAQLEGIALRLFRVRSDSLNPAPWAAIEARVLKLAWNGLHLEDGQVNGHVDAETAQLGGTIHLAGSPVPFELGMATDPAAPAGASLQGRLQVGPCQLDDLRLPDTFTGGDEVRVTGKLSLAAPWTRSPDARWDVSPTLTLDLERIEWPARELTIENLRTTLDLASLDPPASANPGPISVGRLRFGTYEVSEVEVNATILAEGKVRLELRRASLLDGRVWSDPVVWDWRTGDLGLVFHAQAVDLQRLSTLIPRWEGTLSGRIDGRIPLQRKAGHWRLQGGRLELDRRAPASLEYPADGLLTSSMAPDSPRYQQLRLVEEGLKHLTLQALRVDMFDPQTPGSAVRIRLEGTSTSARAIVPVILNLNLNGPFADLLELIDQDQLDRLDFSF